MLKQSIPKSWKEILKNNRKDIKEDLEITTITNLQELKFVTKDIYKILLKKSYIIPLHQNRWAFYFPLLNETNDIWKRIYIDIHNNIKNTKIQSLQYKIIYRVVNCRKKLFDWKIMGNKNCLTCNAEDSIQHFFIDCIPVKKFWKLLIHW
jgi:hypothetical protein